MVQPNDKPATCLLCSAAFASLASRYLVCSAITWSILSFPHSFNSRTRRMFLDA